MNALSSSASPVSVGTRMVNAGSSKPHSWVSDQGDGSYRNPVLYADYSDPDVIRVGGDFYLTASSFNCVPGLPVLHSRDLVNWQLIGHALAQLPHPRYAQMQPGCGVWAPALRYHAGKFWIFFPMPDEGVFRVTASHPAGPWSEPLLVQAGLGLIDPCPFWDDDGRAYLVHAYAGSRAGIKHRLRMCPMEPDGTRLLGEGHIIFHDPDRHPTLEGPKIYKRQGWYYVLAPAGGVEQGWQVALRSRSIHGPYEDRIVLSQGDTDINGPHQGALVDTADGNTWFVHFQDAGVYGRIVHLQPVEWRDGWPLMGRDGHPIMRHRKPVPDINGLILSPATSDSFDGPRLGFQWQWQANPQPSWHALDARPGWLRLYPQEEEIISARQPNFLLQKFPSPQFILRTTLDASGLELGQFAGVVVAGRCAAMLGLERQGTEFKLVWREDGSVKYLGSISNPLVHLWIKVRAGGGCEFGCSNEADGGPTLQTFQAVKGEWIGAKMGLVSVKPRGGKQGGWADFARFQLT